MFHLIPFITSGNQKSKGAAPTFISKAELSSNIRDGTLILKYEFIFMDINNDNKIIEEAIDWVVIKYFVLASAGNVFFCLFMRGIIDKRLISRPIHILI